MAVVNIADPTELQTLIRDESREHALAVVFVTQWHEPCKLVVEALEELTDTNQELRVAVVDVEHTASAGIKAIYGVEKIPTVIFYVRFVEVFRYEGAEIPILVEQTERICCERDRLFVEQEEKVNQEIKEVLSGGDLVIFIKGTPEKPQCKFTRKLLMLLEGYEYNHFNILSNFVLRESLKKYSNWPTYPQIYIKSELVGGLDIVEQLINDQTFHEMTSQSLEGRLKRLISKDKVVLFMKGTPDNPFCGFSSRMVDILNEQNVKYFSFNIFQDNIVREGLKTFSSWPTYPQLYINGELIGGIDIVTELVQSGEFSSLIE
jgi:Grx4 family monothiol glutaredoxin